MLKIKHVKVNYQKELVGVTSVPQFGWVIESDDKNIIQKTYQLQLSLNHNFNNIIYDSGIVNSKESAHILLDNFKLESATKYYARVRITILSGQSTDFSEPAIFVSALIDSKEWEASFISAETEQDADLSKATYLRKEFTINRKVKEAWAFTTALGLYKFYLNGQKVGEDELTPGWTSYHNHLLYQTYDITGLLKDGENAAGAMIGAGWYKGKMGFMGFRNHYGKQTAFLGQLIIRYEDGTQDIIGSDESWAGSDAPIVFSEIYDGEIYDARLEQRGWNEAGFEAEEWNKVSLVEFDKKVLTAQGASRVKMIDKLPAKKIFCTPEGDTCIDFGQNLTGWISFVAKGKKDDKIEINCFEVLDSKGNAYFDNLRAAKQTLIYYFKEDGEIEYHPSFTFQGFQYAKITSWPGLPKLEEISAYSVHSYLEPTGSFHCSNPDLNQLHHNVLWGLKGNFVDVPTDCPQRNERLGWTGDAQIFSRTASYLVNTYEFFTKWLVDVAADQTKEGGVPHVVPDILKPETMHDDWLLSQGTHSAAAWADVAVIMPWSMHLNFGDKEIIKKQYSSMKSWINFMQEHAVEDIWNYKLQFGDWVALDAEEGSYFGATPNDLTCTAYYAYSTGLFAKMAASIGEKEDAIRYTKLYHRISDKFRKSFFKPDGTMTAQTQTAHIIALYFDLVSEEFRQTTVESLIKLLEKENGHLVTGFVGTPYFCHVLSQNGHTKEAYDLLLKEDFPSWLYQVKMGATTVWEHWDGMKPDGTMWSADMNSFNHYAYGAVAEWIYRVVGGIDTDENHPGFQHSILYPHIGGELDYAETKYESPYGILATKWEVDKNVINLQVTIPHNTTSTIRLDTDEIFESDGLNFSQKGGISEAWAGSGDYTIKYKSR